MVSGPSIFHLGKKQVVSKPQYEIHWESQQTGFEGHGKPMDKHVAQSSVETMNHKYEGEINHWLVKVPQ